jgi:multiple sugar transport system permease protein
MERQLTTSIQAELPVPEQVAEQPRRRMRRGVQEQADRGILSTADRRRPHVRIVGTILNVALGVCLVVVGLLPLLWLLKSAITPTQDTLAHPLALFPGGAAWSNVAKAWNDVQIGRYFFNTIWMAAGEWAVQLLVATTGGFALSVLKPRYGRIISGLVLATLFVPAVVLLVPLYLTVLHPPLIGHSLINTFWAVWLPAGASAFNVLLVMRFFDSLPKEVFEAAKTDGAGTFRLFGGAADVEAHRRCRVRVRDQRGMGRLPLAQSRAERHRHPAAVGAASADPVVDGPGRLPGRAHDRDAHSGRDLPDLPAHVPARRRAGRCREGMNGRCERRAA